MKQQWGLYSAMSPILCDSISSQSDCGNSPRWRRIKISNVCLLGEPSDKKQVAMENREVLQNRTAGMMINIHKLWDWYLKKPRKELVRVRIQLWLLQKRHKCHWKLNKSKKYKQDEKTNEQFWYFVFTNPSAPTRPLPLIRKTTSTSQCSSVCKNFDHTEPKYV